MKTTLYIFIIALISTAISSCEEPYTPDTRAEDQQYVIEGFVEAGEGAFPTYVIVSRSIPFFNEINRESFEALFIATANVTVNDGDKDVNLTRICTNDPILPIEIREAIADFLGIGTGEMAPSICVYVDVFDQVTRAVGRSYELTVEVEDNIITATTTIPRHIPIDSFRWDEPPGEPNDSLARLFVTIDDPQGPDFYRYLTGINDRGLIPNFQSSTDDAIFDGQSFEFPLNKAEYPQDEIDFRDIGLYPRGDSLTLKWLNMDKAHFDFWNTRDFSANNAGPFASYTRVSSNIDGALGIWGGYSVSTYGIVIPPK